MKYIIYRLSRVVNGWILEPYNQEHGPVMFLNDIYVFETSEKLAEFIRLLDDSPKEE